MFQEQKHLNLEISRLQNALVPLRLLFPCTSPEPKIQRRFLKGPCAAFGASTAHSDSNHCGPRLRARRPRVRASEGSLTESLPFPPPSKDLADFRQYLLSRSEGGPVNFDAWVQAQHVDSSLGQFHGQLLLGFRQGQFVGLYGRKVA